MGEKYRTERDSNTRLIHEYEQKLSTLQSENTLMLKDNEAMQSDLIALEKQTVDLKNQLRLSQLEVERLNQA